MDHVSIEAAEALSGEEAFILQLRPPAPPGADEGALAARIEQFTSLYLASAGPENGRFARLAPLTWAIAASRFDAGAVEAMRADLCETLFGADDPARAQLARQPGEPVRTNCVNHPSAAARAAFDDDDHTFDLDSAALNLGDSDVFEVDAWRLDGPSAAGAGSGHGRTAPTDPEAAPELENELESSADIAPAPAPEPPDHEATDVAADDVMSALAELERVFAGAGPGGGGQHSGLQDDAGEDGGVEGRVDTRRFEADLDAFEAMVGEPDPDSDDTDAWTPGMQSGAGPVDLESDGDPFAEAKADFEDASADDMSAEEGLDSLTEAPAPRSGDLSAEIAAFRQEMRAIAATIPGAGAGEAVAQFRDEVEAVAGALGQRVDGAAQRIEAAADRFVSASGTDAAERINGAALRAEQSAALMETSVQEAVRALKSALDAAGGAWPEAANGG